MIESCPIPTPEQRIASAILDAATDVMHNKISAAIVEADRQVHQQLHDVGLDTVAPPADYYKYVAHLRLYRVLCGATDGDSFEGANGEKAISIICGLQLIAKKYWGADIEVYPRNTPQRRNPTEISNGR